MYDEALGVQAALKPQRNTKKIRSAITIKRFERLLTLLIGRLPGTKIKLPNSFVSFTAPLAASGGYFSENLLTRTVAAAR